MYNSPTETTSVTYTRVQKSWNSTAAEHNCPQLNTFSMLGSALFHAALLCGTATATATGTTHRAQPIAASDKLPTTSQCCSSAPREPMPAAGRSTLPGRLTGQAASCSGETAAALARPATVFCALQRAPTLVFHRRFSAKAPCSAA